MGLFGVELGAYAALRAAAQNKGECPRSGFSACNPDELVRATVKDDLG